MSKVRKLAEKEGWLTLHHDVATKMRDPEFRAAFTERKLIGDIAVLLRRMRQEAGLTQTELAARAGMPQSTIARLESAKSRTVPSLSTIARLSVAAGIPLRLASKRRRVGQVSLSDSRRG